MKYILILEEFCNDILEDLHDCYIFNIDKSISIEYGKSKICVTFQITIVTLLCGRRFCRKLRY